MANIVFCPLLKIETSNISDNHFAENHPLEQRIETSQEGHLAHTVQIKDSGAT